MSNNDTVSVKALSQQCRNLVALGVQVGWRAKNTANGGVLLEIAHEAGRQSIIIPASLRESKRTAIRNKIEKYADPAKLFVLRGRTSLLIEEAVRQGHHSGDHIDSSQLSTGMPDADSPMMQGDSEEIASTYAPPGLEPTIVRESPWLAARSTSDVSAKRYESGAVIERKWSDGTLDYACSITSCDFTDPSPQRVARHYSRSTKATHPKLEQPAATYATEPYTPKSADQSKRIERLTLQLLAAEAELESYGAFDSMQDWMTALATRLVKDRDEQRGDTSVEAEPLTPEKIIERIRGLVDDGSYLRRIEQERSMSDEITALRNQVDEVNNRCDELWADNQNLEKDRDHYKNNWDALTSLVQENREPSNAESTN